MHHGSVFYFQNAVTSASGGKNAEKHSVPAQKSGENANIRGASGGRRPGAVVPDRDASYDCRHCFQLGNGQTMPPPPPPPPPIIRARITRVTVLPTHSGGELTLFFFFHINFYSALNAKHNNIIIVLS